MNNTRKLLTVVLCFTLLYFLTIFAVEFLWDGLIGTAKYEPSTSTPNFIIFSDDMR